MSSETAQKESLTFGGLELRPIAVFIIRRLSLFGLSFMDGAIADLTRDQILRQLHVFAWAQSAPVREVLKHVREKTWEIEVDVFEAELDRPTLLALFGGVEKLVLDASRQVLAMREEVHSELSEAEAAKSREELLEDGFLESVEDQVYGSITVRPIASMVIRNAEKLGLTFMSTGLSGLTEDQITRQFSIFAWFQSAPIREVLGHLREETWENEVDVFESLLSIPVIAAMKKDVWRMMRQASAATFELQERESTEDLDLEEPPGNS